MEVSSSNGAGAIETTPAAAFTRRERPMFLSKPVVHRSARGQAVKALFTALLLVPAAAGVTGSSVLADDCAGQCRAHHNQCRLATKGAPSCDMELQSCLQRCLTPRKK